jgi:DNA-binding MarR family transcriptional regulator
MNKESHFSNQIRSNYAFLAKTVFDLHSLIQAQSEKLYEEKELGFPVWASSTILMLASVKKASIMEISQGLNLSHQLTSQRIKTMLNLELVEGIQDPNDKRRTIYRLTRKGIEKSKILDMYCEDAEQAFKDLSTEVGCDIQSVLNSAISALKNKPFGDRFPANKYSYQERIPTVDKDEN